VRLLTAFAFRTLLVDSFRQAAFFVACNTERQRKKMNVPTIDIVQTGANIKALRKAAGIKVKDVADTLGVSTQAVAKWQAGTALPTIDNLVILAAMLDTKIDDILVIA
jgi:DNA-binding transcriptional regulator YiaG